MAKSWDKSKAPKKEAAQATNSPKGANCRLVKFPRGVIVWRCEGRKLPSSRAHHKKFAKAARSCRGKGKKFQSCVRTQLAK